MRSPVSESDRSAVEDNVASTRDELGETQFDEVWRHGHDMTLEAAVSFAHDGLE